MKKVCLILISIVSFTAAAQPQHALESVTNITVTYVPVTNVTVVQQHPVVLSATNVVEKPRRGIRQFQKECPECSHMCVSTNATSWTVNDPAGLRRITQVTFRCGECDDSFSDTIERPLRKTPMTELPPLPP